MTDTFNYNEIKGYKSAFDGFKQRFLKDKKSIFNLESDDVVFTKEGVKYLFDNFINNGYTGNASFLEKIKSQLIDSPATKNHDAIKDAIEILATATWFWRLPPTNSSSKGKKQSVNEILELCDSLESVKDNENFFNEYKGFATTGTYYNVNKPTELAYIISFFNEILNNQESLDPIDLLKSEALDGRMKIKTTKDYSTKDKKNNLILTKNKDTSHDKKRTVSIHNALLHLFDGDNYEPILSNNHKENIVKVFSKIFSIDQKDRDKDKIISMIRKNIQKIKTEFNGFYDHDIKNIWFGGLDFESKNIILHGAPGTGKTYLTEESIKARKLIENKSEHILVQFHPSYSYEDFIEGIKPTEIIEKSGQMKFELKNGQFKQMCIDAFKELKEANDNSREPKTYYFIADEINRAELSRVFGELLLCIEDDKRLKFDGDKVVGTMVKTPNSNLWKPEHAVVTLDKDGKISETGEMYFGVPENIYFIGTMNDIDRSVDSFDMALRRRFVWKHYKCDYDVIFDNLIENKKIDYEKKIDSYIKMCKNLNHYIAIKLNLGSSYELGHSYFMKIDNINQTQINKLWKNHISPLLKEYLRSEFSENEIEEHLNTAKKLFTLPKAK